MFLRAARAAKVHAVVAGDGPDSERCQRDYPEAQFLGWIPAGAVSEAISRCRACVFPSLLYEVAPLVVREAAARGVPTIASAACAAKEFVTDGQTGLLYAGEKELVEQLILLRDDSALASHLGRCAYNRYWSDPPTLEKHTQGLLDIYATILASREPSQT